MTNRFVAALFASALLFAACGSGDDVDPAAAGGPSPTAEGQDGDDTDADAGTDDGDPSGSGATTAPGGASATQAPAATPAPVKKASEGEVNRPRAGSYVYDLDGRGTGPGCTDPNGCATPDGATSTDEVSYSGDVMTVKTTSSEGSGATTTRFRWEAKRLLLLQIRTDTAFGSFGCTFEKPVTVAKFPIKVESYGKQTWKGDGCEGSSTIEIVGQEDVKDASGKTWKTWKSNQDTVYDFGSVSGTIDGMQWQSPDLGWTIRSQEESDGTITGGGPGGTGANFQVEGTTALKSHP